MPQPLNDIAVLLLADDITSFPVDLLEQIGKTSVHTVATHEDAVAALGERNFDLAVIVHSAKWAVSDVIISIRHNRMAINPFLAIISCHPDMSMAQSEHPIWAGADVSIGGTPSATEFAEAIRTIVEDRRDFVVTSDYIGPDRRRNRTAPHGGSAPFPVPNTLALKIANRFDQSMSNREIAEAKAIISRLKAERHGAAIYQMVRHIGPDLLIEGIDNVMLANVERILAILSDLETWLSDRRRVARAIRNSGIYEILDRIKARQRPNSTEVKNMLKIAKIIQDQMSTSAL